MSLEEPPVRVCCSQRHGSVACPDGLVVCCLCFQRFSMSELATTHDGRKTDVCLSCMEKEVEVKKRKSEASFVDWMTDLVHGLGAEVPQLPATTPSAWTPGRHVPHRGSDVEAFIKRERDANAKASACWDTLDDLLEAYRLHADTGTPLTEPTPCEGPGEPS